MGYLLVPINLRGPCSVAVCHSDDVELFLALAETDIDHLGLVGTGRGGGIARVVVSRHFDGLSWVLICFAEGEYL